MKHQLAFYIHPLQTLQSHQKPSRFLAVHFAHKHPLKMSLWELPGSNHPLEVYSWFLLQNKNRTEMVLIRTSCDSSKEAINGSSVGKACRHLQYHHTSQGGFCHPRQQIRLRQKHSSAEQAVHKLNLSSKCVSWSGGGGLKTLCIKIGYSKPTRAYSRQGSSTLAQSSGVR